MKKLLSLLGMMLVVLLPACCIHNNLRHPAPRQTTPEKLMDVTVALDRWLGVVGKDEDGDPEYGDVDPEKDPKAELKTYCAGVWVEKDVILTAEHCIHHLGQPEEDPLASLIRRLTHQPEPAWDPTGQPLFFSVYGDVRDDSFGRKFRTSRNAKVLKVDQEHDLALLKVTDKEIPAHPVMTLAAEAHAGDEVHIVGHPTGLWWSYSHGWIAQFRPHSPNHREKPVDVLQISAPVWFGNSGGGVFNEDGQLLGIASWIQKGPNLSFFVDYETIRWFLSHNGIRR